MIIKNVNLETVCGITSTFPENDKMEVAFAGKSNVGKSSLINVLINRKSLARTSAQPGKTQTVNYYNINDAFYLVDLPGYGYTTAAVMVRQKWGRMIERYLHTSEMLYAVFLLLDIRRTPSVNDRQMYEWIVQNGYHPIIIATKSDKINRSQLQKQTDQIRKGLEMEENGIIIPFSAHTKQGKEEIHDLLDDMLKSFNEDDTDDIVTEQTELT
jgi:GTP-binding protein